MNGVLSEKCGRRFDKSYHSSRIFRPSQPLDFLFNWKWNSTLRPSVEGISYMQSVLSYFKTYFFTIIADQTLLVQSHSTDVIFNSSWFIIKVKTPSFFFFLLKIHLIGGILRRKPTSVMCATLTLRTVPCRSNKAYLFVWHFLSLRFLYSWRVRICVSIRETCLRVIVPLFRCGNKSQVECPFHPQRYVFCIQRQRYIRSATIAISTTKGNSQEKNVYAQFSHHVSCSITYGSHGPPPPLPSSPTPVPLPWTHCRIRQSLNRWALFVRVCWA